MFEIFDALLKALMNNGFTAASIFFAVSLIFLSGFACGFLINKYFGAKPVWFEKTFACFLEGEDGKSFEIPVSALFKNDKIVRINCPLLKRGKCKGEYKCLMREKKL